MLPFRVPVVAAASNLFLKRHLQRYCVPVDVSLRGCEFMRFEFCFSGPSGDEEESLGGEEESTNHL